MISIPVGVNNAAFEWQIDLWWWNHRATYGREAVDKACLIVIDKNFADEQSASTDWLSTVPHIVCTGTWTSPAHASSRSLDLPLNIQVGLRQIIARFDDEDILEVDDCDMFHFRPHPKIDVCNDMLITCNAY